MLNKYQWIVVGAGFAGASFARLRADKGDNVLVVEQRNHVGGNAYDRWEGGNLIHQYGPHLFHTNSDKVMAFLSRFTGWTPYEHRVHAIVNGMRVPLPVNLTSIKMLFPDALGQRIVNDLVNNYGFDKTVNIITLMNDAKSKDLTLLAKFVYDKIFLNYSTKQWGTHLDSIDASVMGRVPIRINHDDRYFTDRWQCMPGEGYTRMFEHMLESPRIQVMLNTDFEELFGDQPHIRGRKVFHTGSIDRHYDYAIGALPYRSLKFDHVSSVVQQPVGTINMPDHAIHTRVTDQSVITGQYRTPIYTYETPFEHDPAMLEEVRYYPIPSDKARELHKAYTVMNEGMPTHFAGRLGSYQYLNMDQACAQGLQRAETL
jgi:UDP-galactopyranose mutase